MARRLGLLLPLEWPLRKSVLVGRHGAMNPAGRVRCNIMAIGKGYSCVSQPFFIARLALWDIVGLPRGVTPLGDVSSLTRSPGTSGAFFYSRRQLFANA